MDFPVHDLCVLDENDALFPPMLCFKYKVWFSWQVLGVVWKRCLVLMNFSPAGPCLFTLARQLLKQLPHEIFFSPGDTEADDEGWFVSEGRLKSGFFLLLSEPVPATSPRTAGCVRGSCLVQWPFSSGLHSLTSYLTTCPSFESEVGTGKKREHKRRET